MIEIRRLKKYNPDDLQHIMPGYASAEKYVVAKSETPEQTTITLQLATLPRRYVKAWRHSADDDVRYRRVVAEGLSLGAYDGGALVGIGIAERRVWNRTLWVWELGVDKHYRRRGIGRRLVDALADIAKSQGLRVMVAETQSTNVPAIRFYRAVGFELDAVDLSYYTNHDAPDGEVALFMKRRVE